MIRQIDLDRHEGIHPRVGAIDVAPIVYLDPARAGRGLRRGARRSATCSARSSACRCSCTASSRRGRTRAELRRGGPAGLAERIDAGELRARLRPAHASPDRRRGAGRGAPAARRLQRRAGAAGDRRGRPGDRRARSATAAAKACQASARSACGSTPAAWPRCRPTSRTTARPAGAGRRGDRASRHAEPGRAGRAGAAGGLRGFPDDLPVANRGRSRTRWPRRAIEARASRVS